MSISKTKKLVLASLMLAVGILFPFVTSHALGISGTVLLPMHIPVFISGMLLGPAWGGVLGVLTPVLSALLTGMPTVFPMMPIMACELCTYGLVSGFVYRRTPVGTLRVGRLLSMLPAMLLGRCAYALVFELLLLVNGSLRALTVWGAVVTGLAGIALQLLLVPPVLYVLERLLGIKRINNI